MLITDSDRKEVVDPLQKAVLDFNQAFTRWMDATGCRANFGWKYDPEKSPKEMVLLSVDAMIYRPPLPEWATRQEKMEQLLNQRPSAEKKDQ